MLSGAALPLRGSPNPPGVSKLDSLLTSVCDAKCPGLALLVRKNGHEVYGRGCGVRDLRSFTPIDVKTNFRLASFTKQFTAMTVMLLVHEGKLRYDESLTDIFPDFPSYGRSITVRNLLTHTSGLPDYEALMEEAEKIKGPIWTPAHQIQDQEVLALLKQQSHGKFAPGSSWDYSNSGYVVLGLIAAKVSGEPFEHVLQDRIFKPLQMDNSVAYVNGKNAVPDRAFGHTREENNFVETDQSPTSATLGDGGVYSNLDDLAKWDEGLRRHTLLAKDEMAAALIPATLKDGSAPHWPIQAGEDNLNPGKSLAYGFGWFLDPYRGHVRMWHTGTTMGFRTVIERFTKEKLTVIVLCNRTDLDANKIALQAADLFLDTK